MTEGYARPPSGAPQFEAPPAPQLSWQAPAAAPQLSYPLPTAVDPTLAVRAPAVATRPQRPAVIALAGSLAVVASLLWICSLSLVWVTATVGTATFADVGDNGAVFHILNRFNYRMLEGLAIPLYGFPLASFVTGFLILSPRPWARALHTAVGAAALGWAAWWLQDALLWWFSAAWYIVVACLVLWTPAATAWYHWRERDSVPTR